jgi:hypothetical protein
VRARVAGAQLAGERLAGLIAIGEYRSKPVATYQRACRLILLGYAVISVDFRSFVNRSAAPASPGHPRGRGHRAAHPASRAWS